MIIIASDFALRLLIVWSMVLTYFWLINKKQTQQLREHKLIPTLLKVHTKP